MKKPRAILELEKLYKILFHEVSDNVVSHEINCYVLNEDKDVICLHLRNNQISDLRFLKAIVRRKGFREMWIDNNPFVKKLGLSLQPFENHRDDLLKYFSDIQQETKPVTLPVKVMLLGNHASGKSTFWHYWKNKKFLSRKISSTHVLNVHKYQCRRKTPQLPKGMIYDFGGQDYYHGLYQAFFSEDAVHLLFWCKKSDKNDQREAVDNTKRMTRDFNREYWLAQIDYALEKRKRTAWPDSSETQAPREPLLLVQTHADEDNNPRRNYTEKLFSNNIVNEFHVSLDPNMVKENRLFKIGLDYLCATLTKEIETKSITQDKPAYYHQFLEFILNDNQAESLTLDKLIANNSYKREQLEGETPNDIRKYLEIDLNELYRKGIVLYYRSNDQLQNVVWPNPSKTVEFIHKDILSKKNLKKKKGIVPKQEFEELCKDRNIIPLLESEKAIFLDRHGQNGPQYIIPGYLPLFRHDKNYEMLVFEFSKPNFTLKFKHFIPFGLINQIICLYSECPNFKKFWRDQIIFTYDERYKVWIKLDFSQLTVSVAIHEKYSYHFHEEGIDVCLKTVDRDFVVYWLKISWNRFQLEVSCLPFPVFLNPIRRRVVTRNRSSSKPPAWC